MRIINALLEPDQRRVSPQVFGNPEGGSAATLGKYDAFFHTHPLFTGEEFAANLAAAGNVGPRTQESILAYYRKVGRLVRVRRGLYAVVPPDATPDNYIGEPYLIASRLTPDAVLSYHTALEFHGEAYSMWFHFFYAARRPLKALRFGGHLYRGTRFPSALVRSGNEHFGVLTEEVEGMTLRVASLERTLVDVLDRPDLSGGWEEVWRSLESVGILDLDKVVEYALLLENATTAAKVGFFLDRNREFMKVGERHLKPLRDRRPRRPHYMERFRRGEGSLVPEWNLIVSTEVLEQSWAEIL